MYQSIHFDSKPRSTTNASKPEVVERLQKIVGAANVLIELNESNLTAQTQ